MYLKYYLLAMADTLSFAETVELLISLSPEKSLEAVFAGAVRLKRGMIRTETAGIPGTSYRKDQIYLGGYTRIRDWIDNGGNQEQLFYGKVKIGDLGIIAGL